MHAIATRAHVTGRHPLARTEDVIPLLGSREYEGSDSSKPVLLAVDDEPQVLRAIHRDLRSRYREAYRVVRASSGVEALDVVTSLRRRGTRVALLLVDHKMPEMTGLKFLAEAVKLFPDARRVLFTAYADTDALVTAVNTVGLDYYLSKPWDPPEEHLYPVLDELLDGRTAAARA